MELSNEQREAVQAWVAAGASLSEVQQRLKSEFDIRMTYIDVRVLVLDLGVSVREKPEPKPQPKPAATPESAAPEVPGDEGQDDPYADAFDASGEADAPGMSQVSMTLDRVVVPGAMVSGEVTFSDQVKARWVIDQTGRFGLEPDQVGYRPSESDLQAFQMKLRQTLQQHGYV